MQPFSKALLTLPKCDDHVVLRQTKFRHFSGVQFVPADRVSKQQTSSDDKNQPRKDERIAPQLFKIKIPKCLPNTAQNINTGYILNILTGVGKTSMIDGKIYVHKNEPIVQKLFVIIPQIIISDTDIILSIQTRDAADSRLFMITVYNRLDQACMANVFLFGFLVRPPGGTARFLDNDMAEINVLKLNNLVPGRHAYNLSPKVLFDEATFSDIKSMIVLCFDGTKSCHDDLLEKKVIFDGGCTAFKSRK